VKVLRELYNTQPEFVESFEREAKTMSSLQHPNIVRVFDYGQTNGTYFIVMEMVEGTDLLRYLRSSGILDVERAITIAHDVALGLAVAHYRGVVHRNVNLQNILIGRTGSIKLTSFGGMSSGSVKYYAPEQAQGEVATPAIDIYALGIVMYEMLTSHTPFDGDTPVEIAMQHIQDMPAPPSQFNPNIPQALEQIIMRCLEKAPDKRYHNGSELANALQDL